MSLIASALAWLASASNWAGDGSIPARVVEHLLVTLAVVALAALIAVPIGVAIGHTGRFRFLITATSGAARAIPTLGLLTLVGLWLGIGLSAPMFALLVLAIPPMLTATYAGIGAADPVTVDAARAIGLTERQIIAEVELPAALPLLLGGLRSTTLQVIATATLAAYTADAGLGRFLYSGLKTRDYGQMIAGALLVVVLALVGDALWALVSRAVVRRFVPSVRRSEGEGGSPAATDAASASGASRTPATQRPSPRRARIALIAGMMAGGLGLGACSSAATFDPEAHGADGRAAIVVGSQDYYSNEIIAEAYAQALEQAGYTVNRQLRIGQREVYMPEIQAGAIDVFPEYTGSLLQYLDSSAAATGADEVYRALGAAMPEGLRALAPSPASDQDSYVVTRAFADAHGLETIGDLARVGRVAVGGNSELEKRPYGPPGLKATYGVDAGFTPIEDSGGALTLKALRDGDVQLVDIYSADPRLASPDLVILEDPKGIFLSSRVVPIVSERIDEGATAVLDKVSAALDSADLIEMNRKSTAEQLPAAEIARAWLASEGLV